MGCSPTMASCEWKVRNLSSCFKIWITREEKLCRAVVMHAFNPSMQRQSQVDRCEFKATLVYKLCFHISSLCAQSSVYRYSDDSFRTYQHYYSGASDRKPEERQHNYVLEPSFLNILLARTVNDKRCLING
ncbi:hypothetical protein STEG23_032776 [Scotinomys teguina]